MLDHLKETDHGTPKRESEIEVTLEIEESLFVLQLVHEYLLRPLYHSDDPVRSGTYRTEAPNLFLAGLRWAA